ncbi:MAG: heme exporter protein CcmD [Gammaproteobacteria bacterium]|nr:heme exporter protein CcmD [Gammaproteobacteria bacterium]
MSDFFHMGGHGFYIWSSYATVLVVFAYNYFSPIFKRKHLIEQINAANRSAQRGNSNKINNGYTERNDNNDA